MCSAASPNIFDDNIKCVQTNLLVVLLCDDEIDVLVISGVLTARRNHTNGNNKIKLLKSN